MCQQGAMETSMKKLNLKPTHKPIRDYYEALEQYNQLDITHEGAVSSPFSQLLATCAKRGGVTLEPQHAMCSSKGNRIVIDGAIIINIDSRSPTGRRRT